MTQFLGIVDLADEGRAVLLLEVALASRTVMDVARRWAAGPIALFQQGPAFTQEAAHAPLPFANAAGHVIAGDIRLDNRAELFDAIGIPHPDHATMGDSALVLAAYARWGEGCVARLLGDFAFAIWDSGKRRLFCATDHFATRHFYYARQGSRFVFSSQPDLILAVPGVPVVPNFDPLTWAVEPDTMASFRGATFFAGIEVLSGGALLLVDGTAVRERTYWQPALGEPLRFRSDGDYREAFQHHFFEAVRCRLRSQSPVTALLSGGLDSSSIVAVAAKLLEQENRELDVLSVVLPEGHDPRISDERSYIDLFRAFPNVRINYLTMEDKGPFGDLEAMDWSFGPAHTSRHYNYTAVVDRCSALGSNVLLDGVLGELGPTFHGQGYLAELFRTLRWPRLWRELKARRAIDGASIRSQVRSQLVKPLLPKALTGRIFDRTDVNIRGMDIFASGFLHDMQQRIATLGEERIPVSPNGASLRRNQFDAVRLYQRHGGMKMLFGAPIEQRFPFLDKRLVQFCLDAPSSFKVRDGYTRSMIRIGLDGVLPPEIQWRTTKTWFSPDYMARYKAEVFIARDCLAAIGPGDPVRKVIDVDKILALTKLDIADDESDHFKVQATMSRVPMAIYIIAYLRQFEAFRA